MNHKDFFKGKKVTQLGLGLLGRGLNDAIFMLENGVEDLIVTDKKTAEELASSVEKLNKYKNLTLRLGEHSLQDFENRDFILKGAGVPLDSIYISHAKEKGVPIEMDSSLFLKLLPEGVTVVGVTGTRGKSTTTHLIAHILREALGSRKLGTGQREIFVGGNIRDMATLPLLNEVGAGDYVVLELDSWQLQGFGESKISPHVAVFTTFMPDHLNYYGNNLELYFDDKANIYKFQNENDYLILGEEVSKEVESRKYKVESQVKVVNTKTVPEDWKPKIIGEHNLLNIACAIEMCRALGISEEKIKEGVENFGGVEGRLQKVKVINGITIWNDNNATTPEATMAALSALKGEIVLLCGGADKHVSLDLVAGTINEVCKKVVLLKGTGSEKLKPLLKDFTQVDDFRVGVEKAFELCEEGDNLLFSPMFASFGMFNNEYERNDLFLKVINTLNI